MPIVPTDKDYIDTELIKSGKRSLSPQFEELANWITDKYPGAPVLNIYYDKIVYNSGFVTPRIIVIFERKESTKQFYISHHNFDADKQAAIAAKFREILLTRHIESFDTNNLIVVFSAFEPAARLKAIWSVTNEQIETLAAELTNPAIWKIRTDWEGIAVFFHTDAQLAELKDTGFKEDCYNAYAKILNAYDEFGYFAESPATVIFDSKENFERTYHGSWFNYDRR